MKRVLLKRNSDQEHGTKRFSILQKNEEKDCSTKVYKSFRYHVSRPEQFEKLSEEPEVFITKNFDTKRGIERFAFMVVGAFYVGHNRQIFKVNFQHTLKIQIRWKTKIFSPKKSEILA